MPLIRLRRFKVTTLPATPVANAIYYIDRGAVIESHMTDDEGNLKQLTSGKKVYRAILEQTGTAAPTANVLENTLGGTLVWTRQSPGVYRGTLAGAFPDATKLFTDPDPSAGRVIWSIPATVKMYYINANTIELEVDIGEDGPISNFQVEIIVYP